MELFAEQAFHCPRCGSPIPDESSAPSPHENQSAPPGPVESASCPACGYTLTGVRLYDPNSFVWLGVLFSATIPLFMAGSNWGRLGRTRTKWLCLGTGLLGFGLLFVLSSLLPEGTLKGGWIINLPVALWLRFVQRSTYSEALRFGAQRATTANGMLGGLAMLVCAGALAAGASPAVSAVSQMLLRRELRGGYELVDDKKYDQAAQRFERILKSNPESDEALFNLALCHVLQNHWGEGA